MSTKSVVRTLVLLTALASCFAIGSVAMPGLTTRPVPQPGSQQPDCSKMTDADIVTAVIENIKKRFTPEQIKTQLHLNITAKDGVVEIAGDAHGINRKNPREVRTRVTNIAQKTSCVKKVVTRHLTEEHPIKCGTGQKQCNGGCVDQNAECHPLN